MYLGILKSIPSIPYVIRWACKLLLPCPSTVFLLAGTNKLRRNWHALQSPDAYFIQAQGSADGHDRGKTEPDRSRIGDPTERVDEGVIDLQTHRHQLLFLPIRVTPP